MITNLCRMVNVLSGFNGVSPGGTATILLPVSQRYHRMLIQCQAINYASAASGAAQKPVIITSATGVVGTATVTPTIVNGVVTAVATSVGSSSGWAVNDTFTYADITGTGAVFKLTVATAGAMTTAVVVSGGVAGPIDPRTMITGVKQIVNGQVIRDVSPTVILGILNHEGYIPQYGFLPLIYTTKRKNILKDNEMNSWDLAGQGTFSLQFTISPNVVSPALSGIMEFDKLRNAWTVDSTNQRWILDGKQTLGSQVPFLKPIGQHMSTYTIPSGRYDITTLPFNYPIEKIYIIGSTPGNIYETDILADGQLWMQATAAQLYELNSEYEFQTGSTNSAPFANAGGGFGGQPGNSNQQGYTPNTIPNGVLTAGFQGVGTSPFAWDSVVVFDIDDRPWKALNVATSLILRVYSAISQNLTVVLETSPGAFLG